MPAAEAHHQQAAVAAVGEAGSHLALEGSAAQQAVRDGVPALQPAVAAQHRKLGSCGVRRQVHNVRQQAVQHAAAAPPVRVVLLEGGALEKEQGQGRGRDGASVVGWRRSK